MLATIVTKAGSNLRIQYDEEKLEILSTFSDYKKEIHRFAAAGSISQRSAHRFTKMQMFDKILFNPVQIHRDGDMAMFIDWIKIQGK